MLIRDQMLHLDKLSDAEKNVAYKIIKLGEEIKDMSIREIAADSFTSTSAVTRLSHKLGFKGYTDFKEAFLNELDYINDHFQEVDANFPFSKDDNLARVCHSIGHLYEETSKDTLSLIDYQKLIHATALLNKARNIYVVSIGVGLDVAKVFANRMMRIGKNVIINDNFNNQFYFTYNAKKYDCFLLISYTGSTFKSRQLFNNIKNSDASSILITSVGENDLSKEADVVLRMTTREKLYSNIATFSSTVSIMLILDLLYSSLFHKDYEKSFETKKQLAKIYEPSRYSINDIMKEEEE